MTNLSAVEPVPSKRDKQRGFLVAFVVAMSMAVLLSFFALRLAAPGDGTQTIFPTSGFVPEGLPVRPIVPAPAGLQANDIVTAIQGRVVNDLIRDAFTGNWENRALPENTTLQYEVLRNNQPQVISVRLEPFPLARALQDEAVSFLGLLATFVIALYVFTRRPLLLSAQLFLATFALLSAANVLYLLQHQASDLLRGWVIPFEVAAHIFLYFGAMGAGLHFALTFPRRHPVLARRPYLIPLGYAGIWVLFAVAWLIRMPAAGTPAALLELRLQSNNVSLLYYGFLLLAIFSNVRHLDDEVEQRQIRWIGWGVLLNLVSGAIAILVAIALNLPVQTFLGVSGLFSIALPVTFAIAILRENLFDIDLVINRTLIYGPLTALLAVLFTLTNALMNFLISGIAGEKSQITLIVNTAVVVLAFNPLKDKLQEIVDKRFKAKPNPAKQLESLAEMVRAQTTRLDTHRVMRAFLRNIVEGYEASYAQLKLDFKGERPFSSFGKKEGAPAKQIPLMLDKAQVGALELGARRSGRKWTDQDVKIVSDTAHTIVEEILAPTLSSS